MSQLVQLEGKHTNQNARCAVWIGLCVLALVWGGYILGEYIFLDEPKSATCLLGVTERRGKRAK